MYLSLTDRLVRLPRSVGLSTMMARSLLLASSVSPVPL